MKEVLSAAVGVTVSLAALGVFNKLDQDTDSELQSAVVECLDRFNEGNQQDACVANAANLHSDNGLYEVATFVSGMGVLACGYLQFKTIKNRTD